MWTKKEEAHQTGGMILEFLLMLPQQLVFFSVGLNQNHGRKICVVCHQYIGLWQYEVVCGFGLNWWAPRIREIPGADSIL